MHATERQFTLGLALTCAALTLSLALCAQAQTYELFSKSTAMAMKPLCTASTYSIREPIQVL